MRRHTDVLLALGFFAIGVVLYWAGLFQLGSGPSDTPMGVRVGLLAVICCADAFRRRAPVAASVVGLAAFGVDLALAPTIPVWIVLSDVVYAAVLYGGRRLGRATIGFVAVAALASIVVVWTATNAVGLAAAAGIVVALFFGTPVWGAVVVRRWAQTAAAEKERAENHRVTAELDRAAAVAHERATMARDLHDIVAGHLSAIAIQSEAARSNPTARGDEQLGAVLAAIRSSSVAALTEMRTMIDLLHGTDDPESDGVETVRTEARSHRTAPRLDELDTVLDAARAAGNSVEARVDALTDDAAVPNVVQHTAYRIVHESITNAVKHAPGANISLRVEKRCDVLHLEVCNRTVIDRRRDTVTGSGHGLRNMTERARVLGGDLTVVTDEDRWTVTATLPLHSASTAR